MKIAILYTTQNGNLLFQIVPWGQSPSRVFIKEDKAHYENWNPYSVYGDDIVVFLGGDKFEYSISTFRKMGGSWM